MMCWGMIDILVGVLDDGRVGCMWDYILDVIL